MAESVRTMQVFFCYAHEDELLLNKLKKLITINIIPQLDGSSEVRPRAEIAVLGYGKRTCHWARIAEKQLFLIFGITYHFRTQELSPQLHLKAASPARKGN